MARVTHVKSAQARYRTVPVMEDGKPKRVPVMSRRTGQQKTTKTGKPIFMTVTVEDRENPLPLRVCDYPPCGKPIEVGTPYKHVTPKSGPYGGRTRARHAGCPTWREWDLSNSLGAQLARISNDANEHTDPTDPEAVAGALRSAAESIREIAEQKRESASNITEGFGHDVPASEELNTTADSLEEWANDLDTKADEIEAEEVPDEREPCGECSSSGRVTGDSDDDDGVDECAECGGDGEIENPAFEEFQTKLQEALDLVDESPV